jgi:flagellar basal-body rod protein FlgB
MANSIDNFLGVHAQALAVESRRTQLLASNLANSDTPNYKARDVDFRAALAQAGAPGNAGNAAGNAPGATGRTLPMVAASAGNSLSGGTTAAAQDPTLLYRVPLAPSLDGNTVDPQLEQAAFAENAVRYQATLTLLNSRLRSLMTAITGQ